MTKHKLEIIVDDDVRRKMGFIGSIADIIGVTIVSEEEFIEPVMLRFVVEARYNGPYTRPDMDGYCRNLKDVAESRVFTGANDVKVTGEVMKDV